MNYTSVLNAKADTPSGERRQATRTTAHDGIACESYEPGHQMHYLQQGKALRSLSVRASEVLVDGDRILLTLESGQSPEWRHHDPARVRSLLGLFPTARVVYPAFHALRVGPYWFNCAPEDFVPCAQPTPPSACETR